MMLSCLRTSCSEAGWDAESIFCPLGAPKKDDGDIESGGASSGGGSGGGGAPTLAPAWALLPSIFEEISRGGGGGAGAPGATPGVPISALAKSKLRAAWRATADAAATPFAAAAAAAGGRSDSGGGAAAAPWHVALGSSTAAISSGGGGGGDDDTGALRLPLLHDQHAPRAVPEAALMQPAAPVAQGVTRDGGFASPAFFTQQQQQQQQYEQQQQQHAKHGTDVASDFLLQAADTDLACEHDSSPCKQAVPCQAAAPELLGERLDAGSDTAVDAGSNHNAPVQTAAAAADVLHEDSRSQQQPQQEQHEQQQQQQQPMYADPEAAPAAPSSAPAAAAPEAAAAYRALLPPADGQQQTWQEQLGLPPDPGSPAAEPGSGGEAAAEQAAPSAEQLAAEAIPPPVDAVVAPGAVALPDLGGSATDAASPAPAQAAPAAASAAAAECDSAARARRAPFGLGAPLVAVGSEPSLPATPPRLHSGGPEGAAPGASPLRARSDALAQQQQQQQDSPTVRAHPGTLGGLERAIPFSELELGALIGEGGFARVYFGRYRGRAVAVKVLSAYTGAAPLVLGVGGGGGNGSDGASGPEQASVSPLAAGGAGVQAQPPQAPQPPALARAMADFRREASAMLRVPPHPNVLQLVGVSAAPPLALVTDFCPGGSLYGLLHCPSAVLTWRDVASILRQAAAGMAHLHRHGVLHRDLKSANLLLAERGAVKVADFGLARLCGGPASTTALTGGLGTFQFMAPEVLANQRYSSKADVYAFGVVAWECCARRTPYEGMNGVQAAMAVVNRGLRPQIPAHTPPALADLIRACWAAVPEQRPPFESVCEWVRAIEAGLEAQEAAANAAAAVAVKVAASPDKAPPSPPVTLNAAAPPSPWPPLSPAPPSMGV